MTKKTIPEFLAEGFSLPSRLIPTLTRGDLVEYVTLAGAYDHTSETWIESLEVRRDVLGEIDADDLYEGDHVDDDAAALGATEEIYAGFKEGRANVLAIRLIQKIRTLDELIEQAKESWATGTVDAITIVGFIEAAHAIGQNDEIDWDSSSRYC